MTKDEKWDLILKLAENMGVSYEARMKWRQRQIVPHKWRINIVISSDEKLTFADFTRMDRIKDKQA